MTSSQNLQKLLPFDVVDESSLIGGHIFNRLVVFADKYLASMINFHTRYLLYIVNPKAQLNVKALQESVACLQRNEIRSSGLASLSSSTSAASLRAKQRF